MPPNPENPQDLTEKDVVKAVETVKEIGFGEVLITIKDCAIFKIRIEAEKERRGKVKKG